MLSNYLHLLCNSRVDPELCCLCCLCCCMLISAPHSGGRSPHLIILLDVSLPNQLFATFLAHFLVQLDWCSARWAVNGLVVLLIVIVFPFEYLTTVVAYYLECFDGFTTSWTWIGGMVVINFNDRIYLFVSIFFFWRIG